MPLFHQGRPLALRVGDYQEIRLRAPIAAPDARRVAGALKDPAVGAYPPEQVHLLLDAQDTRDGVLAAPDRFAHLTRPTDTVFLFFYGHGCLGEDDLYYFMTRDVVLTPGLLVRKGTGARGPEILERLRALPAGKLLFVIHACDSGHINPSLGAPEDVLGAPPSATLGGQVLATGAGRAPITASRPAQLSFYRHSDPHSYFGQALIDGLSGRGVADSGGYIGLNELYQHVYLRVKVATDGAQDPVLTIVQVSALPGRALSGRPSRHPGSPADPADSAARHGGHRLRRLGTRSGTSRWSTLPAGTSAR